LYTDGSYADALAMFKKSIAQPSDAKFSARATFWKGETEFVLNDFGNSLISFKQFVAFPEAKSTPEYKNINYNIAYAYFKQKEYDQAGNYFQNHIDAVKDDKPV
jgi:TolA-binding protein